MPVLFSRVQGVMVWNISPGQYVALPPAAQHEQVPVTLPAVVTSVTGTEQLVAGDSGAGVGVAGGGGAGAGVGVVGGVDGGGSTGSIGRMIGGTAIASSMPNLHTSGLTKKLRVPIWSSPPRSAKPLPCT